MDPQDMRDAIIENGTTVAEGTTEEIKRRLAALGYEPHKKINNLFINPTCMHAKNPLALSICRGHDADNGDDADLQAVTDFGFSNTNSDDCNGNTGNAVAADAHGTTTDNHDQERADYIKDHPALFVMVCPDRDLDIGIIKWGIKHDKEKVTANGNTYYTREHGIKCFKNETILRTMNAVWMGEHVGHGKWFVHDTRRHAAVRYHHHSHDARMCPQLTQSHPAPHH